MDNQDNNGEELGQLSWEEAGTMFHNEIHACINRWRSESDLPFGMLISTLSIEKARLEREVVDMIEEQEDQ